MVKLYVILFSDHYKMQELTTLFDSSPTEIKFWFYNMPNSLFIKSPLTSQGIYNLITSRFGVNRILVMEVPDDNRYGFVPTNHIPYFTV